MDLTLLKDGFILMIIGMGTVFIFLTIMIWTMNFSREILQFINKFFPEEILQEKKVSKKMARNEDEDIAIAILCAMTASEKQLVA